MMDGACYTPLLGATPFSHGVLLRDRLKADPVFTTAAAVVAISPANMWLAVGWYGCAIALSLLGPQDGANATR